MQKEIWHGQRIQFRWSPSFLRRELTFRSYLMDRDMRSTMVYASATCMSAQARKQRSHWAQLFESQFNKVCVRQGAAAALNKKRVGGQSTSNALSCPSTSSRHLRRTLVDATVELHIVADRRGCTGQLRSWTETPILPNTS
jgi:hypothetical protein